MVSCVLNGGSADTVSNTQHQQPVQSLRAGCGTGQRLCAHVDSSNLKEVMLGSREGRTRSGEQWQLWEVLFQ